MSPLRGLGGLLGSRPAGFRPQLRDVAASPLEVASCLMVATIPNLIFGVRNVSSYINSQPLLLIGPAALTCSSEMTAQ